MDDNTFKDLPYRPCVGITLFNREGKVFVGERIDNPGAWQMPQGGIDKGETVEQAFFREMREEIGTDKAQILEILNTPLRYDLPHHLRGRLWNGRYRGQEQFWVAALFTGEDDDIDIYSHKPPEFQAWQWIELDRILDLIVPFKQDTYRKIINAFAELAPNT